MVVAHSVGAETQTWSFSRAASALSHWALATAHLLPFLKSYPIWETQAALWIEGWNMDSHTDVLDLEATAQMRGCSSVEGSQAAASSMAHVTRQAVQTSPQTTEEMAQATCPPQPGLCQSLTELATLPL